MSAPFLDVELDPGPWDDDQWRDYRLAGDKVSGRAIVQCETNLNCRGIHVKLGWHTEGKGDKDQDVYFDQVVHHGELLAGRHEFPFSARLPMAPMSYAGHHIKIIWAVHVRIDIAWKVDPKFQRPFYVTLPWDEAT